MGLLLVAVVSYCGVHLGEDLPPVGMLDDAAGTARPVGPLLEYAGNVGSATYTRGLNDENARVDGLNDCGRST